MPKLKGWKKIGDSKWISSDRNKIVGITMQQDRDGRKAFLYKTVKRPNLLSLNPKRARRKIVLHQGRDFDIIKKKTINYLKKHPRG